MKNTLTAVFIAIAIALGAACIVQWQKLGTRKTQIASLQGEAEQKSQEVADLQSAQQFSEKQRQELSRQTEDLAKKLQAQQAGARVAANAPTNSDSVAAKAPNKSGKDKGGFGDFFAKMMEDPETKKMMREQQRMTLDQLYDPLIKKMDLTPEEASQFKDLLADNMMKAAEKASSLFNGGSSTNQLATANTLAAEQKDFDEQVRAFLGETRYAQYKDYQETVGERSQLNQFRMQTAGGQNPLTDAQTEQLLLFMKEERQAVASASSRSPGESQDQANLQAIFSGDGIEKLLQNQDTASQRVYERARDVLSVSQLDAFGRFQTNQLQMMRMGMSMARKFMAPEASDASTKP